MVTRSLDLFLTTPARRSSARRASTSATTCCAETDSLDGIAAVCAHPQALAQCHAWLSHHLPGAERRPVASNAEGARLASLDAALAGIASERAASEYGLHVVAPAIQDDAHNRHALRDRRPPGAHPHAEGLGPRLHQPRGLGRRTGRARCTTCCVPLKAHGVSMTRFESRPARSGQWEYYFYIDLDGHPDQPHVAARSHELRDACAFFKLLGTYPVDSH